eukprot:TRINITY_DN6455_c0_g1_i1.p1 TRINITY_DN6455_c0_g1~~TRINITY_DN6455_c0_g1_i1.p1  ORF type:complete len:323 (-),score=53.25 TRINITY_DN6455_c0_g1_i1:6-974(-)
MIRSLTKKNRLQRFQRTTNNIHRTRIIQQLPMNFGMGPMIIVRSYCNNKRDNKSKENEELSTDQTSPDQSKMDFDEAPQDTGSLSKKSFKQHAKDQKKGPDPIKQVLIVMVVGFVCVAVYWFIKKKKDKDIKATNVQAVGEGRIGGEWTMVDQDGIIRTRASYDCYQILYFGFTYCPDVCPMELQKMTKMLNLLEEKSGEKGLVQCFFVSVDPYRDSVEQIREYIAEFDDRIICLTGTPKQVNHIVKSHRAFTMKGPSEREDDYVIDHSVWLYLMDKDGKYIDIFGADYDAELISEYLVDMFIERGDIRPILSRSIKKFFSN